MRKFLSPFESKFETPTISEGAFEQSALRVNIISNARRALNSAANLINIDAPIADTVQLNSAEKFYQPSVNREFNRIVTPDVDKAFNRMIEQEALAPSPVPVDVVPVPSAEQSAQAAVNQAFNQITAADQTGLVSSQVPSDIVPLSYAEQTDQTTFNQQFENIAVANQATYQQPPVASTISLTEEHPNQAAINEALLRAMAIHDQNGSAMAEDLRV